MGAFGCALGAGASCGAAYVVELVVFCCFLLFFVVMCFFLGFFVLGFVFVVFC